MIPFLQRLERSCVVVQLSVQAVAAAPNASDGERAQKEVKFEWFENEDIENVVSRFTAQLSQAAAELHVEQQQVSSTLHIDKVVNPSRSADSLDHEVLLQLVNVLQPYSLREVVFKDNCEYVTTSAGVEGLVTLTSLDLTACGLTEVPEVISALVFLQTLYLRRNKLTVLPSFLGSMLKLEHLDADDNLITTLPESLQDLTNLHTLSLSNNRLKAPIVNLSNLNSLCVLHLGGNPLQYFPELSQAPSLLTVSLANLLVVAEPSWTSWNVEMLHQRTSRLTMRSNTAATINDTLKLLLSRSSAQHPLIAGGLAEMAQDEDHRNAMLKAEGLLPQLVHAMLSENIIVAAKSCETVCKLTTTKEVALDVEKAAGISAAHKLMLSSNDRLTQCGLAVMNELAFASEGVACRILSQQGDSGSSDLLADLMATAQHPEPDVQCGALVTLSTLAFPRANKLKILQADGYLTLVKSLAAKNPDIEATGTKVRMAALRVLAVLGQNDLVDAANGKPPIRGRGVRVLALDGGGMKGMTEVTMLREIEKRTGKRMHELFDVIGGTSTGCMVAVGCGVMGFTLDEMEAVYMALGSQIFAAGSKDSPNAAQEPVTTPNSQSWSEGLMKLYRSGEQGMRVAMYGAKHNTPLFEELLQEKTNLKARGTLNDMTIDATCLSGPKVFGCATKTSVAPATPYVFRTYEFAPNTGEEERAERLALHTGSSKHKLWQAIRASSAAPYYLDDFSVGDERFIDGAVSVNNPSVVAVQEARMLYPDLKIDCFVSLGVGIVDFVPRARGMSTYFETGSAVIEGASSISRPHEALSCMLDMADCVYERFCPMDARCGIPLDCTDEKQIKGLVQATQEYIEANSARFQRVCDVLMQGSDESLEVDRSMVQGDLGPAATGALVLAAPVSGSCLAGQLVHALQGLQHASIVDLQQFTKQPASVCYTQPDVATPMHDPAAKPENAQLLPANGMVSGNGAEVQLNSEENNRAAAEGNSTRLRLTVPNTNDEAQANNGSADNHDAQPRTPTTSDLDSGHNDSAVVSHPVQGIMGQASFNAARSSAVLEAEHAQTAAQAPETSAPAAVSLTWPSLSSLSTALSGKDKSVRSSYEETPTVQKMVHGTAEAKEVPVAANSPSSGLLGMLVSMVSTSISPKRDESSIQQLADSTFQAASPSGTAADAEEVSERNGADATGDAAVNSTRPVLSPLNLTAHSNSSPNGSTPFDEQELEMPKAEVGVSQAGAKTYTPVEAVVETVPGDVRGEATRRKRDPLGNVQDIGFVVVAAHFVAEGMVAKYSQNICQVVEGSEAAKALQVRLGGPSSAEVSGQHESATTTSDRLGGIREPVQTVDGTGAWFKCLLQHSQAIACPGSGSDAPILLNTLLMQEFRPESVWPVQELLGVLRKTSALVVLPHAVPPDVVDLVMGCGPIACLVAKQCVDATGNLDGTAEAALCVAQVIEEVRSGNSLHTAMLRSDADKYFDLLMP